ncbi:unnamed protein product [Microthlaspi erraticum]|uniref:Uncharacterized protein n=1 Tax=Microthlaspi erraticum TaxID=1685480 RepID=A0A6D2KP98_9BRAS|nr:unnamed protein product [Microthlaspi erraticum]
MSGKRANEAHGGFGVSNGPSSSAKGLGSNTRREEAWLMFGAFLQKIIKECTCEKRVFWSIWSIWDVRSRKDLAHGRSSTGYAKEEGGSHLEDQLDHLLDQPVEFLNSTGQASTRSS